MAKHRINIANAANGAISVHHAGNDTSYCEAGELVMVKNQPTAGWGLMEAHYTDPEGNYVFITQNHFYMPDYDIEIVGTFKRFELSDWASGSGDGSVVVRVNPDWVENDPVTDEDVMGGLGSLDMAALLGSQGSPVTALLVVPSGTYTTITFNCGRVSGQASGTEKGVVFEALVKKTHIQLCLSNLGSGWFVQEYTNETP